MKSSGKMKRRSGYSKCPWMRSGATVWMIFSLVAIFSGLAAKDYTVVDIPNPKEAYGGFVSDPDELLNLDDKQILNDLLQSIETTTSDQVAVVIVQSIGDAVPKDFAVELFNTWGIGQKGKDNGLLILTVVGQRAWEIEVGYGLEGVLNDARVGRIGRSTIVPFFREGNYGKGLIAAVNSLSKILMAPENQVDGVIDEIDPQNRQRTHLQLNRDQRMALVVYLVMSVMAGLMLFLRIRKIAALEESAPIIYQKLSLPLPVLMAILFPLPGIALPFLTVVWRRRVRYRPKTGSKGQPMSLLSENADDKHLKAGELCEEINRAADYDVWISEDREEVMILRYNNPFSGLKICDQCKYKTMKHIQTVILESATEDSTGKGMRISKCLNCSHQMTVTYTIPRKTSSSSSSSFSSSGSSSGHSSSFGGGHSGGGGAGGKW